MSIPVPPHTFEPVWLSPDDVKAWLKLNAQDASDDALILAVCAMTEPYVQRCRPEWFVSADDATEPGYGHGPYGEGTLIPGSVYRPDSETYQGARMYAAREYRRRNSPSGIETFGDVTSFVARYDPDIDRALQTGAYARPVIA